MNARLAAHALVPCATRRRHAVVLLGTGVVGGAFLKLLDTPAAVALSLVGAANSRHQQTDPRVSPSAACASVSTPPAMRATMRPCWPRSMPAAPRAR